MATKRRTRTCTICGSNLPVRPDGSLPYHGDALSSCPGRGKPEESKEERDRRISLQVRDRLNRFFGG